MVRLVQLREQERQAVAERFNPTVVRLVRGCTTLGIRCQRRFNPTVVRLVPEKLRQIREAIARFNPTVVRLVLAACN